MRRALAVVVAVAFLGGPQVGGAQPVSSDPDVAAGIKQVEEGDYDAAILTLDNAARRLGGDPARVRELSQAYLYLGIAYVGKGHEAAAKAKFREAVSRIKDLTLSPDRFPPKVIDLFEAARDEARTAPATVPSPAAPVRSAAAPASGAKKGGSKTLLWVGLGGAVAGGVALAAGGGGSDSRPSTPTGNNPNTPTDTRTLDTFTGSLPDGEQRTFRIVTQHDGLLEAQLSWPDPASELGIILQEIDPPYTTVANSRRTSTTTASLTANVGTKGYLVIANNYSGRPVLNFTLSVKHP